MCNVRGGSEGDVMLATPTKMHIERRYYQNDKLVDREVYEGEVTMDPQQKDYYKQLIGDGKGSITAGRPLGHKDFGTGGDVFVSVTLTCDQSEPGLNAAIDYAKYLAETKLWQHFEELKQQLIQRGILKT